MSINGKMSSEKHPLDSSNEKLDKLSVSILSTIHNIITERQYLDDNLREGFINIAKSRYIMRGQDISMLQINTSNLQSSVKSYSMLSISEGTEYTSFISLEDVPTAEENNLKHRPIINEDELCADMQNVSVSCSETGESEVCKSNLNEKLSTDNPLKWFGVLVPDTLKVSQKRFKLAADTALKVASLQNELKALCANYRSLRLRKKEQADVD